MSRFFPKPVLHIGCSFSCQITDGTDSLIQKLLLGSFSQKQQITDRKRPHFLRGFHPGTECVLCPAFENLMPSLPKSLLVEIPTFYCESQLSVNLVFQLMSSSYRVRIDQRSACHIQKYLINGKGLPYKDAKEAQNGR